MKFITLILALYTALGHNPVYNVIESDPQKNPNNPLVPQLTTNYEQMMLDRSKRLITIGEPQKDPLRHVEFSPVHHYDEEVEFVSDIKTIKPVHQTPMQDKDVYFKITELEQMIYSLYELKNDNEKKEFLRGEESPIDQFLMIIGNSNQGLSLQEIHVLDRIRQLIVFLRKKEEDFKGVNQTEALSDIQKKVKHLSFLIDQRDFQQKVVQALDTDIFTYNRTMAQLDAPVQYYASRVQFFIKKGEVYDLPAYVDLGNFNYFAQRKSKQQMIYRKMSIIRAKNMTGDLEGQQNAIINLLSELSNELRVCEEGMRPLNELQNQIAIIAPQENVQKINQVMQSCVDNMNKYPEIQHICKDILITHDFSTVNTFKKLVFMIKQEVSAYEISMSSIITQIQLGRAAQDAVNLRYISNVYQNLNRMATECSNNQKKISANQKISDLISAIQTFRQNNQTVLQALQNTDNILFETNKGTFWDNTDAQLKEFQDGNEHFNMKLNSKRMLDDKLSEIAGKLAIETTPENCHQAEDLMETAVNFQQRQEKLTEFNKYLEKKEYPKLKQFLLEESDQLQDRQLNFEDMLTRLGDLEIALYQMDLKSAQEKVKSLTKEKWLRSMAKLRLDQAYGMLVIGERRQAAGYLADSQQELNADLQHIIGSERDVNQQLTLLEKISSGKNIAIGQDPEQELKHIIEITQDIVIFDAAYEDVLIGVRMALVDGKGKDASDKIGAFADKDNNHKHENEVTVEDIKSLTEMTKKDFEEDDFDVANRHSEQLVQMIQQAEKQSDILFTIRAVITFGKQGKKNAMAQAVEDLKVSIQKEFFAIENKQKQMEKIGKMISELLAQKEMTNVKFNQILFDIRSKVFINNRYYDLTKMAIQLATNNDQQGARASLKDLSDMLKRDINDLETSKLLVDQQQQLLADDISDKDDTQVFHLIEQVQHLSRQQVNVMTDEHLNIKQNEFVGFRNEKDHLKSLNSLEEISSKGQSYISLIDEKMADLKDVVEPTKVYKSTATSSEMEPIKISPVSVSNERRSKQIKKNKNRKSKSN